MTDEYQRQVGDIIKGQSRASSYQPDAPQELFIKDRKLVLDLDGLSEQEVMQIVPMFKGNDVLQILSEGYEGDGPINLEIASVVDDQGVVRYRYWGMDFGALYLMAPDSLDVVAFTAQHHMEHWHADQRPLFWAMDRAILRGDHGFQQMAQFCWWNDDCWARIADKPRGSVGSEPFLKQQFAD